MSTPSTVDCCAIDEEDTRLVYRMAVDGGGSIVKNAGGAAAAGGFLFQHRVAAWLGTRILGEASLSLGEVEQSTPSFLQCESAQPVDDILVRTSNSGFLFFQVKGGGLALSQSEGSEFGRAIEQFVRQFLAGRPGGDPLVPNQDRLVLAVAPECSGSIGVSLRKCLRRLRGLAIEDEIVHAALNEPERRALSAMIEHVKRCWRASAGENPADSELRSFLEFVEIRVFALEEGGSDENAAKDLLRNGILSDRSQADAAWDRLNACCAEFAAERSGGDARRLQDLLNESGIQLRALPSFRNDIERLRAHSKTTELLLRRFSHIELASGQIKIRRHSTEELQRTISQSSVVVVGEPGAGKSGAVHDVAKNLLDDASEVLFLAADRSGAASLGDLRQSLGLEHEVSEVLRNWVGSGPAFLIIDGLDAARAESVGKTFRDLIRLVTQERSRWRVLASIRRFDLRHSPELQELFRRDVPPLIAADLRDQEFESLSHIKIPVLDDTEIAQIAEQSDVLASLMTTAQPELKTLLRVPFNLHLLAELLNAGVEIDELVPIRTQIELLERYWKARVKLRNGSEDGSGDAREAVLRVACETMVQQRSLRVERSRVARAETSEALSQILSSQVLEEEDMSDTLNFQHHVLFDYAVARLLIRGPVEKLVQSLEGDPDLAIIVRPSLVLHFQYLWITDQGRDSFWNAVFATIASEKIPEIGKLVGPSVAAKLGKTLRDFERLRLDGPTAEDELPSAGERAVVHLIGALLAEKSDELVGANAGPWCALLEALSQ
jgi:hypothetical protein